MELTAHIIDLIVHTVWAFVALRCLGKLVPLIEKKTVTVEKRGLKVDVK